MTCSDVPVFGNALLSFTPVATNSRSAAVWVEREAKLLAPIDFCLPDLSGVLAGTIVVPQTERLLNATYYDTGDQRLLRAGITLRHRSGEPGLPWAVKLPQSQLKQQLTRQEIGFEGPADQVPEAAADLVLATTRGLSLVALMRLHTLRQPLEIRDRAGLLIGEVVDDTVTVTDGPGSPVRFREVEIEAVDRGEAGKLLIEAMTKRLIEAGCVADTPIPKLVRALGTDGVQEPEVVVPALGSHATVNDLLRHAIARSVAQLLRYDPGVRLGDDPEDVHQLRVATRRLRSDLRSFEILLDTDRVGVIRDELGWLGEQVGMVRDKDVLADRLSKSSQSLPDCDAPAMDRLLSLLGREADTAHAVMIEAMRSPRYLRILDALVDLAATPPLVADARFESHKPVRIAAKIVSKPWRRLAAAMGNLDQDAPDDELHRARILAKRARYAAEAVAPIVGRAASRHAGAITKLQTCLGDHQDTVVAEAWLRHGAATDPITGIVAGQLIALERSRRAQLREQWPTIWRSASNDKLQSWLRW